jgi:hypothetical protein
MRTSVFNCQHSLPELLLEASYIQAEMTVLSTLEDVVEKCQTLYSVDCTKRCDRYNCCNGFPLEARLKHPCSPNDVECPRVMYAPGTGTCCARGAMPLQDWRFRGVSQLVPSKCQSARKPAMIVADQGGSDARKANGLLKYIALLSHTLLSLLF